jgi:glycosyltransferase involved in cell wall biosynthesis
MGAAQMSGSESRSEDESARYRDVEHVSGVSSGTDALVVALRGVNVGSGAGVKVGPSSFTATARAGSVPAHVLVLLEGLPYPFDPRVRAEVDALQSAGFDVTVAGPTGYGHDRLDENIDGVRVVRYRAPPGGRGALGYAREFATAWLRMRRLVRQIHLERRVDLAFICNPPDFLALLARPLARTGARVLFDYREISPELFEAKFGRRGILFRLLLGAERLAFKHSDVVITVSEPCAEIARNRGGVSASRVFLVGNGPDPRRIFDVPTRPELRRGRRHLVLWMGAMSKQEGLERLIEAADELVHGDHRRDTSFALIGPGDAHADLREAVRHAGLESFVEVSEAVGDDMVRAYLATADVCVNVDEQNSMNDRAAMRKVLEYMAARKAVVQFPLKEMERLCGNATVYAHNADAHDLAVQVAALLDDQSRRVELGARARQRVMEGLMWPQQIPTLLAAVETALGERLQLADAPDGAVSRVAGQRRERRQRADLAGSGAV